MAKKSSSKRTLKSLFSRSEASLDASVEKEAEKNDGEKRRFKFLKFRTKSKSGSESEKSAKEEQQVLSAVEPNNAAEQGEGWANNIVSDNKRSSLYATTPRTKNKEISYSEMDLSKPKRFATFSFGFKKRKKKDEENISKSTFVLHNPDNEEQEETPRDLNQMKLDQVNMKTFSMSQPELDSSRTFDIPSPPPVATNQLASYFTLTNQSQSSVSVNTQLESKEPLTNGFDVHKELLAPITTIPELQLDDPDFSENIPAPDIVSKNEVKSSVDTQSASGLSQSQPPIILDTLDHKAATIDSFWTSSSPFDTDVLQQFDIKDESASAALYHQPDAPDTVESAISNIESSLASVNTKNDAPNKQSAPVPQNDKPPLSADTAATDQEVSISNTERANPETTKSVNTTLTVSGEESTCPAGQDVVYGALYESLFPQNFTSEVISSLLSPSPQIRTRISYLDTNTEPVMAKTFNESRTETNIIQSCLPTSREFDSAVCEMNDTVDGFATLREESTEAKVPQTHMEVRHHDTKTQPVMIKIFNESHTEANILHSHMSTSRESDSDICQMIDPGDDFTSLREKSAEASLTHIHSEIRHVDTKTQPVMIKILNESQTEANILQSRMSASLESDSDICRTNDAVDNFVSVSEKSAEANSPQIYTEMRHLDTKTQPVMIKILNEFHTEANIPQSRMSTSHETDSASNLPQTEMRQLDTKVQPVMVKILYESHTEANTQQSQTSTSHESDLCRINDTVDGLASPSEKSAEADSPQIYTEMRHLETKAQPIMIKILNESHTEANIPQSRMLTSHETDSAFCRMNNANSFASVGDKSAEANSPQTEMRHLDTKVQPVMVKILSESHTEDNILQSRMSTSHESDSVICKMNDPVDDFASLCEKSTESNLAQVHTEMRHLETKTQPVMVKILSESHTEANIVDPHMPTLLESDSDISRMNDTADGFASPRENSTEANSSRVHTERRPLETKTQPVMVKILNESHTEANILQSGMSASLESGSDFSRMYDPVNRFASLSEKNAIPTPLHANPEIHQRYLPSLDSSSKPVDSSSSPYSELSHSHSEVKSDSSSLVHDSFRLVPVCQNAAPPVSDYVTSQETDTRVTDSKDSVILIKELVTDEASAEPGRPAPVPNNVTAVQGPVIKINTTESLTDRPVQMDGNDGLLSPTYLSIGSDDGSAMEVYYSAEEDNAEENEEMFTMDSREDIFVVDGEKELYEEFRQQVEATERGIIREEEDDKKVLIVKVDPEGGRTDNEEKREDCSSQTEVQLQLRGQRPETQTQEKEMCEFLVGNDARSAEKERPTTTPSQMQEEREEVTLEELLAAPVQQVNTLMVCDFAPPSSELQGEGSEGNWTANLETEDLTNGKEQLPSQKGRHLASKDVKSLEYIHATSSYSRQEDVITPTFSEAEEQVPLNVEAENKGEVSKDTISITAKSVLTYPSGAAEVVTGSVTHSAELQSDSTEIEHNRTPPSSEWADTITQYPDRNSTVQKQVAVELSAPNADIHHPDTEAAEALSETQEHPAEALPDRNQGSLTASKTPTSGSEVFASESQESVDKMNSAYSSLSTKLSFRSSAPAKEEESKLRFHKVSLIDEADTTDVSQDTVDADKTSTTVTESKETDFEWDYKWKNRFEGVNQYKSPITGDSTFSDSLSYRMSDSSSSNYSLSSSSTFPEATAYTHLSNATSSSTPEEHTTLSSSLSDRTAVYLTHESEPAEQPKAEWRRSLLEQEEPVAPAGEREGQSKQEAASVKINSPWDSQQLPVSDFYSTQQTSYDHTDSLQEEDEASRFTGVFKATLVELVSDPAVLPSTPPASPEEDSPNQFDMDSLVDTLKNMGPSLRPRGMILRPPAPVLVSSLPPIVEDAPSPIIGDVPDSSGSFTKKMEAAESLNGLYTLPSDLGLRKNVRDSRSPLELMKQNQDQPGTRGLTLPLRATTNSIVMRKSSDSSPEELQSPSLNGNGFLPSSTSGSRLDNSFLFGSYRSSSVDQPLENGKPHRPLFRTSSLPETGPSNSRLSAGPNQLGEFGVGTDPAGTRSERFSYLLNSSSSSSGSLSGLDDLNTRISQPPPLGISSPPASNSPTRLLSPTGSIDLQRPFTDSPLSMFSQTPGMGVGTGTLGTPILQRSFSHEGTVGVQTSLFSNTHGGPMVQSQEPDRNLVSKYRAFPDAYLTKEKEHGKLNPRPGKMYIFDRPGMCGQRLEIRSDVIDATSWELQETISIRVVRGGWVLYEKPNFKGEKIALDEGDIELTYPFSVPEEQPQNGQKEGEKQNGETSEEQKETTPTRRFIIGSIRRAVRDYSVPDISLFPEENAEGKKVIFRDTSEDARIFGFPIKANSIIINAGLWLVYAEPFFQGVPRVLEVGGYANPAAWGVEQPYVGSLHPLKVGEPRVENLSEPKMVIYDKPYFTGKSRTITTNMRDFMTRTDRQQTAFMYSVGSLKVLGGIWVGYEKEGFRGHQYLLEEGEYHDWRVWGGCNSELRSVRVIRADLTDPVMVMFEQPEEDQEGMQENTFEVTEAIPDVELFGYKTSTRSIHVISGAWVAYSHVDFSGNQYILEKGFYNNCADWGSLDTRICSAQPILMAPSEGLGKREQLILYSEPDFQGQCHVFDQDQEAVPEKLVTKSCRVAGASWVLYENKQYSGNMFVLSEGDYPNLTSMGCPPSCAIRSAKVMPMMFSVPSISLFGLEGLEGREITTETEIQSMVEEGFNNHILSVRVNSGSWVICEHCNYRGRQFVLEPIEITNWPKFSSLSTIGSMYPVRQKRHFFHIKNKESGNYLSIQGGVEEMKSGRVVAAPEVEPMSDIWYYQDGLLKNKLSPTMALQVMSNIEPGAKVVLWTETRQPIQHWTAQMSGLITSLTFPGMVLDLKGGKTYDKDHVIIMPENDERPSQQWEIELL